MGGWSLLVDHRWVIRQVGDLAAWVCEWMVGGVFDGWMGGFMDG